ncbi:hypothetical protein V8D89_006553 [Ganoderma adspersum]
MSINKIAAERNQRTLLELVSQPGNDVCADCKSRNPRWASYSLGIFICMNCASIHRKMGTHISKVKSLTMDTWSKEQVEVMKSTGNTKSNAHFNSDETKHPPPTNMIDQERDSDLEKFIRSKYQYKSFVNRSPHSAQVAALLGPSRSASTRLSPAAPQRSATMPPSAPSSSSSISKPTIAPALTASSSMASTSSVASPAAPAQLQPQPSSISNLGAARQLGPQLGAVQTNAYAQLPQQSISIQQQQQPQPPHQSSNPLWNDLAQLQAPSTNSSLPLQFASPPTTQLPNPFTGLSASPNNPFPSSLGSQPTGMGMGMGVGMFQPGGVPRSMSLNSGMNTMSLSLGAMPSPGFQPQFQQPGLSTPSGAAGALLPQTPLTAPAPSPFIPSSSLPSAGFAQQQPMSASFGRPLLTPQPQPSPMFQPSPQPSPMFSNQSLGMGMGMGMGGGMGQPMTPQPQMGGNPFGLSGTPQPQPQSAGFAQFSSPQVQGFTGSPSPAPFMQQQQQPQQMFGQQNMGMGMGGMQGVPVGGMPSAGAFAGTGWGQQQGFAGQQPWGGM